MEGSIQLHRKLLESEVFASEKRLKVWVWILLKASYKTRHVPIQIGKGESVITLNRGQLLFGRFKAEESLNIDGSTIYRILQWMESHDMIKIESNNHCTILTINEYDTYQTFENQKVTADEQPSNSQLTTDEHIQERRRKKKKDNKEYTQDVFSLQEFSKLYFKEEYINNNSLECFDKLLRLDKYSSEQIKEAIKKACGDDFWVKQFLSPLKLRNTDKNKVKYIDVFLALKPKQNGSLFNFANERAIEKASSRASAI